MLPMRHYNQNWIPTMFDSFFNTEWPLKNGTTAPAINVVEDEKKYKVELAAPGMDKDDFQIHIDQDNNLVIKMEHKSEKKEEKKSERFLRREFSYSKFQQTLILPEDVDKQGIEANMKNGVLSIDLPKQTPEQKQQTLQQIEVH